MAHFVSRHTPPVDLRCRWGIGAGVPRKAIAKARVTFNGLRRVTREEPARGFGQYAQSKAAAEVELVDIIVGWIGAVR